MTARTPERFLYLDPSTAGIAGNMLVAALLDGLEAERRKALLALFARAFRQKGFKIRHKEVQRRGFRGFFLDAPDVEIDTHDLLKEVERVSRVLKLSKGAQGYARGVIELILDLEAEVHGKPREHVHLHEISSYDTIFDAAGGARALDEVGFFEGKMVAYARPVEVGSGKVTFSHGTTSVPAPVCDLILHRHQIPFTQHADREVATPTGLAMLAMLRPRFDAPPPSLVRSRGVGAGSFELPDRPNLLVVQVRERLDSERARPVYDAVAQIEVSLDDVPGETAGHALARALDEGALDAHIVLTLTKKGRPGHLLLVLAREEDAARIADLVAEETGSWGVRIASRVARYKAVPQEKEITFSLGSRRFRARAKYLAEGDRLRRVKVEYEDLAKAARLAGVTLAEARESAEQAARAQLGRRAKGKRP
jgi:hypothetical protein